MWIAIAVNEGKTQHAYVKIFEREEETLRGELAHGIGIHRCAGIVFLGQAAAGGAVNQPGAGENKAADGSGTGSMSKMLGAQVIHRVSLFGARATKEGGAMDHGVNGMHGGGERIGIEEVAFDKLDMVAAQMSRSCNIAHQGTHVIASLGEIPDQSASNFSGGTGNEDGFHGRSVNPVAWRELEKTALRLRFAAPQNRPMLADSHRHRIPAAAPASSAVANLAVDEYTHDLPRIALPHPEIHLVVRFGPSARRGLDVHALGVRQKVHRKLIHGGQRAVLARLHLGTHEAVLGVPAREVTGRVVALEDLWGNAATEQLLDRLARTSDTTAAAAILERAIVDRVAMADRPGVHAQLALDATHMLASANVNTVACDLGVSERHFRRMFREAFGVSPKTFAKLTRFHRALSAARQQGVTSWAGIAATAGYYDQAHLIAEFRAIAGVTPRAFLAELRGQVV